MPGTLFIRDWEVAPTLKERNNREALRKMGFNPSPEHSARRKDDA